MTNKQDMEIEYQRERFKKKTTYVQNLSCWDEEEGQWQKIR